MKSSHGVDNWLIWIMFFCHLNHKIQLTPNGFAHLMVVAKIILRNFQAFLRNLQASVYHPRAWLNFFLNQPTIFTVNFRVNCWITFVVIFSFTTLPVASFIMLRPMKCFKSKNCFFVSSERFKKKPKKHLESFRLLSQLLSKSRLWVSWLN